MPGVQWVSYIIEGAMAIHIAGAIALMAVSLSFMRRAIRKDVPPAPLSRATKVVVLVPVGMIVSNVEQALDSLLNQNYSDYRIIFISASTNEPAAGLINTICNKFTHASHVVAGKARYCCQKNHNLLAGLKEVQPEEEVLVFCDSSHIADPDFLRRLVAPIINEEALMTSGYHYIVPGDKRYGTFCHLLTVQTIHMLFQAIKAFAQPWGGAMAIRKSTFYTHDIPKLWSTAIVDDFTMGPYLESKGIRVTPVPDACLRSPMLGQTVRGWERWLFRQLQYLKFGLPLVWVIATALPILFLCILAYVIFALTSPLWGEVAFRYPLVAGVYLSLQIAVGLVYTKVIPNDLPPGRRVLSYFLLHVVAVLSFLWTWTTNIVSWQNVKYRVKLGGEVVDIIKDPLAKEIRP